MKTKFLLGVAMLCSQFSFSQYIPAIEPEYSYGAIAPLSCTNNDVGTDTRDASGGSNYYANFLNVTVNSCRSANLLTPTFNWESSHGTSGVLPLVADAYDPDVVLVSPDGLDETWAVVVFYSQSYGGYCMSVSQFIPGPTWAFTAMSAPMLIQSYAASNYEPHINIDADKLGHYAVVMQMSGFILSKTQTHLGGAPPLPANPSALSGLMEPDVAYMGNGGNEITVVAINTARDRYRAMTRTYAGAFGSYYTSPLMPGLYEPRIAAPVTGGTNDYAVTVGRQYTVGPNFYYDILLQINEGAINVLNNGYAGLPTVNVNNRNIQPCLSYTYSNYMVGEKIAVGWFIQSIGGSPIQTNTFIGLDIYPGSALPSTGSFMDISNIFGLNNESTLALSGRHTSWAKTAAFTYATAASPTFVAHLVWKYVYAAVPHWKPTSIQGLASENEGVSVYPNPATNEVNISIGANSKYSYEIYNQLGQVMQQGAIDQQRTSITVQGWASGLYVVKMQNKETQDMSTVQFVKQ